VVTSVPVSHATPAGFAVHNVDRDSWVQIARAMVESSAIDVVMGAGNPWYDREGNPVTTPSYTWIGRNVWNALVAGTAGANADEDSALEPWKLLQSHADFEQLMTGETPERVFGVVQARRTLQLDRAGDMTAAPFQVPLNDRVPTLADMTTGALNVLDGDEDGFFLMVEGGATDLAAHDGLASRMIEEEIAFDRSVEAVMQWVDTYSNWGETLVIVTSDHETGYLVGPGSGDTAAGPVWQPLGDNGAGVMPALVLLSDTHTNSLVPFYAKGDAARVFRWLADEQDLRRGPYLDNTEIHQGLLAALGLR
jgi:alkaline phosphatase